MSDSPIQTVLQQRDARPVAGEHLEVLGKKAASDWVQGKYASLNEAVVDTLRGERLSPEQVKRVVEFTNGDAYLQEFRKEGSHRVVHFDCGPADPAQVLQDLNDGGGGSVYDRGELDYHLSPELAKKASLERGDALEKTAAAAEPGVEGLPSLPKIPSLPKKASAYEDQLWDLLGGGKSEPLPYSSPLKPLTDVRDKLAGARGHVDAEIDGAELDYAEAGNQLYFHVKQAALEGVGMQDVIKAWSTVTPDPVYVKVAFRLFTPRFQREGVFHSLDELGASLTKRASVGEVNPAHPMIGAYADFVSTLNKLASLRALRAELDQGCAKADTLLKQAASGGLLGAAKQGLNMASEGIDSVSPAIARALVGQKDAKKLAPTLAKGLKVTGLVGGGLVGNAALQQVTDQPLVRSGLEAAKSVVPGTAEYQMRRYRNMTGQ
jgi:hypothetical protein